MKSATRRIKSTIWVITKMVDFDCLSPRTFPFYGKDMGLSQKAIEEYKEAYKKAFGREITDQEAQEKTFELLSFFKLIYKPIPEAKKGAMRRIIKEYEGVLKSLI